MPWDEKFLEVFERLVKKGKVSVKDGELILEEVPECDPAHSACSIT